MSTPTHLDPTETADKPSTGTETCGGQLPVVLAVILGLAVYAVTNRHLAHVFAIALGIAVGGAALYAALKLMDDPHDDHRHPTSEPHTLPE